MLSPKVFCPWNDRHGPCGWLFVLMIRLLWNISLQMYRVNLHLLPAFAYSL
jgi:hypothetical protein